MAPRARTALGGGNIDTSTEYLHDVKEKTLQQGKREVLGSDDGVSQFISYCSRERQQVKRDTLPPKR